MTVEWVHEFSFTKINDRWTRWSQNTLHGRLRPATIWRTNVTTVSSITDQRIYISVFSRQLLTQISVTFLARPAQAPTARAAFTMVQATLKSMSNYPVNVITPNLDTAQGR
jgi:hypothetical protein